MLGIKTQLCVSASIQPWSQYLGLVNSHTTVLSYNMAPLATCGHLNYLNQLKLIKNWNSSVMLATGGYPIEQRECENISIIIESSTACAVEFSSTLKLCLCLSCSALDLSLSPPLKQVVVLLVTYNDALNKKMLGTLGDQYHPTVFL